MEEEVIEVTITKGGKMSYEVNGVKGEGCKTLTAPLDELMTKVVSHNTKEYYEGDDGGKETQTNGRF